MRTEPELLNERLDRLALVLDEIMPNCANLVRDAMELLKEQDNCENCAIAIEDRQPVIRCEDCINCIKEPNGELYCDILAVGYEPLGSKKVNGDWFCADGRKKDD